MDTFLLERHRTLEAIEDLNPGASVVTQPKPAVRNVHAFESRVNVKAQGCPLCPREPHPIRLCRRFLQRSAPERLQLIRQHKLCINCFARQHQAHNCTSLHTCFTCKGRHHTLLHQGAPPESANPKGGNIQSTAPTAVQNYMATNTHGVLLGFALVDIHHRGCTFKARALIDSGSEASFISERIFNIVKPSFQTVRAQVAGLNKAVSARPEKLCHFRIGSPLKPRLQIEASAFVLPQLVGELPSRPVPPEVLGSLPDIQLADPSFHKSSQIDILIGADMYSSILLGGSRSRPNICGSLLGQETVFGWVLSGPLRETDRVISAFTTRVSVNQTDRLDALLTKFWVVEDLPDVKNESQTECEASFRQTTRRGKDGRFVVSLPFKEPEDVNLGHSRYMALAQLVRNETRLAKKPALKEQYDAVIQEYLDMGHMREVPASNDRGFFYLPHHAVLKPDSTTTQIRVVFNASSPSSNGLSLNDVLHAGPVLQTDLTLQMVRWRFFRFAFNADITKMYRQISLDPSHTRFQRILFRDRTGHVKDYELLTVTFGVNCAPFLALRVLQQLSEDIQSTYPRAS
ncbi:hypothetical protein KR018_004510, partial [Drosophila ironensis]